MDFRDSWLFSAVIFRFLAWRPAWIFVLSILPAALQAQFAPNDFCVLYRGPVASREFTVSQCNTAQPGGWLPVNSASNLTRPTAMALLGALQSANQPRVWCVYSRTDGNNTTHTAAQCNQPMSGWTQVNGGSNLTFGEANVLIDGLSTRDAPRVWCVYTRGNGNRNEFTTALCAENLAGWLPVSGGSQLTFGQATQLVATLSGGFAPPPPSAPVCDWSVYKNDSTGALTMVSGNPTGPIGSGVWRQISPGNLCCPAAAAMAGKPASMCTGTTPGTLPLAPPLGPLTNSSLTGTTLTYYPATTPAKCQADCEANPSCKGYNWIAAGTYQRGDPAMCYLLSTVTGSNPAPGQIAVAKTGSRFSQPAPEPIPPPSTPLVKAPPVTTGTPGPSGSGRWVLQSTTVSPQSRGGWTYSAGSPSARFVLDNGQGADFHWTAPPQSFGPEGFPLSITVSSPNNESSIDASGDGIPGYKISLEAGPVHKPSSQTKQVTFQPGVGATNPELVIGVGYGDVKFHYVYKKM